jgi:hypothetical protein
MHCGSSWRPPRRTAFAGRLGLLFCVLVLALGVWAGPASAYTCGAASSARTLTVHVSKRKDCEPAPARPTRRRNADPMSFVFFMGVLFAFVLVPIGLGPREEIPPE